MDLEQIQQRVQAVVDEVEKVIVGKRPVVELACVSLFANGHLLIEDVPGTGKTMLARSIARAIDGTFKRIQFTPDLLPSDITGTSIFNQKTVDFEFHPGPVFANIVLADEINRATPKTQSSLLECMEEFQVTVDGVTRPLPAPFFVIATQNNVEYQGTYALPEAQLDRFVMRLSMGYPSARDEASILDRQERSHPIESVKPQVTAAEVELIRHAFREVRVSDPVKTYIVDLANATREHEATLLGASPRGSLDLMHSAQALAGIRGRTFVLPDDAKQLATAVLAHRLMLRPDVRLRRLSGVQIVQEVLKQVPVPVEAVGVR
jgi:MoxR-like ATPase